MEVSLLAAVQTRPKQQAVNPTIEEIERDVDRASKSRVHDYADKIRTNKK